MTVLSGPDQRRWWTFAEKLRMVQECLAPEAIVAEVARRHDIHPNHFMHGDLGDLGLHHTLPTESTD
jgi:transposase-like protein